MKSKIKKVELLNDFRTTITFIPKGTKGNLKDCNDLLDFAGWYWNFGGLLLHEEEIIDCDTNLFKIELRK